MGVPNLLQALGPLVARGNIYTDSRDRGRIGVDGHAWLHQLAYAHAEDIVIFKNYTPLARSFMQQLQSVMGRGLDVVIVFDGAPTPAKGETDMARQMRRQKAYTALQYEEQPGTASLRAAVGLGWPAVEEVVRHLREGGIPYFIAPYEADAQLAYLASKGLIAGAQTVDSDFIIHGLPVIYYKVNWRTGRCFIFKRQEMLHPELWPNTAAWKLPLMNLLRDAGPGALLCYALVAGCDYDTKIKGIGPKKAIQILNGISEYHGVSTLSDPVAAIPFLASGIADVTRAINKEQWEMKAKQAVIVFENCLAYNPDSRTVVTKKGEACHAVCGRWPFLGAAVADEDAENRALGHLDCAGRIVSPDLPAVSTVACPYIKHRLSEDMVPGGMLLPQPWPSGYPTIPVMSAWLKTRHGMPALSNYSAAEMRHAIRLRLAVEHNLRLGGGEVLIRDPTGRSLQSYVLQSNPECHWHFAQDSGTSVQLPDDGWVTDMQVIGPEAPIVELVARDGIVCWAQLLTRGGATGIV